MIPPFLTDLALVFLAMLCAAGLAWAFIVPRLNGELQAEQRIDRLSGDKAGRHNNAKNGSDALTGRRKVVEDSLKAIEDRQKKISSTPPLSVRLERSGTGWTKRSFYIFSVIMGAVGFFLMLFASGNILIASLVGFASGFGLPHWYVSFRINRRIKTFLNEFPNAVDAIIRGVKAGLPLMDCFRIVANESEAPICDEFKKMLETQAVGVPLADAVEMLYEHIPVAEANFFGIVISVQQRSGGNLSEILGNLSKVLRDRKKMKGKITAMSMEAKSSAAIIGSLPLLVMLIVYITTPDYISLLFTTGTGNMMLAGSGIWMSIGVLTMAKMINFDF